MEAREKAGELLSSHNDHPPLRQPIRGDLVRSGNDRSAWSLHRTVRRSATSRADGMPTRRRSCNHPVGDRVDRRRGAILAPSFPACVSPAGRQLPPRRRTRRSCAKPSRSVQCSPAAHWANPRASRNVGKGKVCFGIAWSLRSKSLRRPMQDNFWFVCASRADRARCAGGPTFDMPVRPRRSRRGATFGAWLPPGCRKRRVPRPWRSLSHAEARRLANASAIRCGAVGRAYIRSR
jgi:hypothetical protein